MIGNVYEFEDLQKISGFERRGDVERWADRIGVSVKPCRGGVWTTLDALNHALGLSASRGALDAYAPDVI